MALEPEPALKQTRRFAQAVLSGKFRPAPSGPLAGLSPREQAVLRRTAEGQTSRQIAEPLFIDKRTVEGHRSSGLKKLGLTRSEFLARYGGDRAGLLDGGAGANGEEFDAG
ncbi:MAG: LuxR family transcriptional regulator [Chloroflexota bacterium]|nr:LuxR family transcriptional regulator [Chloroflexota bacterium]